MDLSYRQNPKVEILSRTWAPSVLSYPFVLQCFGLNFGALGFGLPLRFTGFWHEITRRLLAEAQHFACCSFIGVYTCSAVVMRILHGFLSHLPVIGYKGVWGLYYEASAGKSSRKSSVKSI